MYRRGQRKGLKFFSIAMLTLAIMLISVTGITSFASDVPMIGNLTGDGQSLKLATVEVPQEARDYAKKIAGVLLADVYGNEQAFDVRIRNYRNLSLGEPYTVMSQADEVIYSFPVLEKKDIKMILNVFQVEGEWNATLGKNYADELNELQGKSNDKYTLYVEDGNVVAENSKNKVMLEKANYLYDKKREADFEKGTTYKDVLKSVENKRNSKVKTSKVKNKFESSDCIQEKMREYNSDYYDDYGSYGDDYGGFLDSIISSIFDMFGGDGGWGSYDDWGGYDDGGWGSYDDWGGCDDGSCDGGGGWSDFYPSDGGGGGWDDFYPSDGGGGGWDDFYPSDGGGGGWDDFYPSDGGGGGWDDFYPSDGGGGGWDDFYPSDGGGGGDWGDFDIFDIFDDLSNFPSDGGFAPSAPVSVDTNVTDKPAGQSTGNGIGVNAAKPFETETQTSKILNMSKCTCLQQDKNGRERGLCWAASIATILNYRTGNRSLEAYTVADKVGIGYDTGGTVDDIANAFSKFGYSYGIADAQITMDNVISFIDQKQPLVLCAYSNAGGHAVTITGYTNESTPTLTIWNSGNHQMQTCTYQESGTSFTYGGYKFSWFATVYPN